MKKLILLLIFVNSMYSQNLYFSTGIDIKNGISGSNPTANQPALDLNFKFGMVSLKKVEITINYEQFNRIDFWKFGFGVGKQIVITDNFKIIPTVEYNLINRSDDWGGGLGYKDNSSSHLAFGASIPFRYEISNSLTIEIQSNILHRTDIKAKYGNNKWVVSNFLNVIYKLNL